MSEKAERALERRKKLKDLQEKVKNPSPEQSKAKVDAALAARKKRITSNLDSITSDLNKKYSAAVTGYNLMSSVNNMRFGEDAKKTRDSIRPRILAMNGLMDDFEAYRSYLGDEQTDTILTQLGQMKSGYMSVYDNADILSQYKSAEAYEQAIQEYQRQQKEQQDLLIYDVDKGRKRIEEMQNAKEEMKRLSLDIHHSTNPANPSGAYDQEYVDNAKARYSELADMYGDSLNIGTLISKEQEYYNKAVAAQSHKRQSDYYEQFKSAPDFAEKSKYVTTYRGGEEYNYLAGMYIDTGYDDIEYDAINGDIKAQQKIESDSVQKAEFFYGTDKYYLYQMTKDEIAMYNYLYASSGKAEADKYLDFLYSDLTLRQREYEQKELMAMAEEDPFGASVFSIAMSPLKAVTAISQVADYADDGTIDQNAGYNKYSYIPSAIRAQVSNEIAQSGKWGDVGSVTYQWGMSMGDFLMNTAVSGGNSAVSLALMGSGAMADATIAAKDRGLSDDQAFTLGIVAGAAEIFTEKFSLDALFKGDMSKGAMRYILTNAFTEGTEEVGSSLINLTADVLVSKDKSEWQMAINAYLAENPDASEQEAFQKVLDEEILSLGLDFLGGVFMGGTMGSGGAAINYTFDARPGIQANRDAIQQYGDFVPDLLKQGLDSSHDSDSYALAKQYQNKTDKGKSLTGYEIRQLVDANERQFAVEDLASLEHEASDMLMQLGEHSNVQKLAELAAKRASGQQLTRSEVRTLARSQYGAQVSKELLERRTDENNQFLQYSQDRHTKAAQQPTEVTGEQVVTKTPKEAQAVQPGATKAPAATIRENRTVEDSATGKKSLQVAEESSATEDGSSYQISSGKKVIPQKVVSISSGKAIIQTDNGKIAAEDIAFGNADMDLLWRSAVQFNGITPEGANGVIRAYQSGTPVATYLTGAGQEFKNGFDNLASGGQYADKLTPAQRTIIYDLGQKAAGKNVAKAQSNVDTVYAEAKEILESGKKKKGSSHAVLEDNISPMQLNKAQNATYRLADEIAQAVQTNIRVYAGKDKAQGFYNHTTDEIWLNLNAADTGREAVMAFTLAHEIVHRSKKGSPAKYKAFANFLMKEYGKQGSDVEAMIAEQIDAAKRFNKTVPDSKKVNMTREKALEEVVCDACQRMLLDTNAGQKLAEFGAQSRENKSFLEDLKRWITELLDKLRNFFKDVEPDSLAAKEFAKFDANVKQILADMYVDMSIEAGEKLSTIKAAYGGEFAQKFHGLKDISYNLAAVDTHKAKMQKEYSEDSSTDLGTIMKRYDKIIDIWTRLGGELNSKFLTDWNSKISKDRSFTIFKAQAGYKYNVELSSMCKKGVPLFEAIDTIVKQEVMKELEIDVLGKAEKEILYDILKQHHFEIPCAICYVEQARQREGVIIDAFLNGKVETNAKGQTTKVKLGWNQVLDSIEKEMKANSVDYIFAQVSRDIATEKYTPANLAMDSKTQVAFYAALKKIANQEIARYNKAEGKSRKLLSEVTPEAVKECFKGTLPANLKIFKVLFEEPSSRFKIQKDLLYSSVATQNLSMAHNKLYGLFNSQGGVSGYKTKQGTTIYWGDILGKTWKPDALRNEGGVRNQSNSDFQMYTLLDQAQMYIDFTAKGYYLQAYTKVLSELKLFGLSRGKINASLIPKVVVSRNADGSVDIEKTMATAGLDENGNPIYDDIEGINHDEAFMLIEDPEYSKSICGICIGYSDAHINKLLDDNRVQQIIGFHDKNDDGTKRYKGARYAKNYNGLNEAVNKEGKTIHIGFNPYVKKAEKKFKFNAETETYEGTVKYNGKTYTADDIPRLATDLYLEMCAKKEYTPAYKDFAGHRNYYKLLADFGLYDSQGHYAPHRKVVYNMPDTVPYLDAKGKKQTMSTYDYIKAELVKELTVRDSIAEALADTSDEGIIPQFKEAVKKSQEEKSFSLPKTDSEGNQLSAEQQEYFKDSQVRDKKGNLLVVYHGTTANFNIFKKGDVGFHFGTKGAARGRAGYGKNVNIKAVYLNITNPIVFDEDLGSWDADYRLTKELYNRGILTHDEAMAVLFTDDRKYKRATDVANKKLASVLQAKGYDGIAYQNTFETKKATTSYIAFSSNQAKETTNLNPTADPDIRYSLPKGEPAPTFYSHMAKVVDGVKQEKLGAASVVSMLRGKGVKAEEIKWSGIETFLDGKKSVTKAELQEFIAGSMLQIEEEVLSNEEIPYTQEETEQISKYEGERDVIAENLKSEWKRIVGTDIPIAYFGAGLESAVVNNLLEANATKKGNTEAGYKYKEARAALQRCIEYNDDYFGYDNARQALREAVRDPKDFMSSYELTSFEKGVFRDFIKAQEAYRKEEGIPIQDQRSLIAIAASADRFSSRISKVKQEHRAKEAKRMTKWGQYTVKGGTNYREILFRLPGSSYSNEAMDAHWDERDGVLAHARLQDYNTFIGKMLFIEEIQSDWHNAGAKYGYTQKDDVSKLDATKAVIDDLFFKIEDLSMELTGLAGEWEAVAKTPKGKDLIAQYDLAVDKFEALLTNPQPIPDAPFKDTYHEYVLKRLIRMAAEQDYDSIGWTTADVQMERWNPSRRTNEQMGITDAKNPNAVAFEDGYRIEYDQDIPKFLNKYGKKWDTKVGKTVLDNGTEVWSMAITDSMKDSVLYEGQVMYSLPKGPYSYETLISKPDMVVTTVGGNVPNNRADVAHMAKKNATKVGKFDPKTGSVSVHVEDIDTDVILSTKGLRHGLRRTQDPLIEPNYIVTVKAGEILKNSIRINEITPEDENANSSYVLIGVARDANGTYVVRFVVNHFDNNVTAMDVLYAINAKKELAALNAPRLTAEPLSVTSSTISIEELLNLVNQYFPDILPEEVLKHYGYDSRPDGDLGEDALYKLPVGEDTSPRALLANAFEGIVTNDIEKRRLQEYKSNVEMLNAEEQKLHELRAEIKELSFAKGKRDTKRIKDLQFDAIQTANRIATLDKILLRLEAAAPLQNILQREKQMAYKRAEQKGKEALEAYRKAERERDKQWQIEVKEKYQASKQKAIETRDKREAREKLQKLVLDTVKWISYPSKTDVKCPDILKQPYADFLNSIDLSSQRLAKGGDPTKNDLRLANAMSSLATALDKVMTSQDPTQETTAVLDTGYLDLPANFVQKLRDMTEDVKAMMGNSEYVVNKMPAEEVRRLTQMIRTLNHAIKEVSTLYANLRFANVEELGANTMSFVDSLGEVEKTGGIKDFVQWDNALPYYAFKRFGEGGESIFEGLMDAQDKLAFLAQKIFDFREKTWTDKEAKAWSEDTHKIELPDGEALTLTTADAMSIYCLSRRQQGLQHLLAGGARVMGIQKGSQKAKDSRSLLTIKDIETIISSLTDRQKQVADAVQEFMSTVCSDWGNEISMKRFLTKEFNEKFYFPIESNDENLATKDPSAQQSDLFRLLNISATKPIDPRANNEVIIRNVFDVFTNHAADMARLNAYGMALLDYMKWLNYREKTVNEEGQINVRGVRKSMEKAFGTAARSYVLNLVKDVNGRPSDGGLPSFYTRMLRNAKTAMVGSSLRVATLQITSYPRAALVLSPKSLALGLSKLPKIEMAKKYCGIALWKSFGFYDTNISRSIEDQMKGVKDVRQKLIEWSLKGAEIGDAITWGALWNACEYEVAATKKYKVGTEEFYQAVGKKLREVVYRTQVVDSTLTRSEMMRSKNAKAQELSAFMSEPTLSANIIMDAGFEFNMEKRRTGSIKVAWNKTGKYVTRALAVYSVGQLAAALLEGLWDAWRDDEDEEFSDKFLDAFVQNLILDLLPFNKIPIISEMAEAALSLVGLGYFSSDNLSSTALTQTVAAAKAWADVLNGKSSATSYNALYKTTRALSSWLGISVSGVMREGVALWNNTAGVHDTTLKIRQYELSKGDLGTELYNAIMSGDTKQAESLKAQFDDADSINSAIRKALRENDPRIKEAAQAQVNGDPSERVRIAKQIIADGFTQDDVVMAIKAEVDAITSSDSSTGTKKKPGYYTAADFALEIANGDYAAADAAKVDIIQTAQKNGKSEEDAVKSFNSSAKTELKELFLAGEISEQETVNALTTYCDIEKDDAKSDVQYWAFKQDYPDVFADDSWFDTYYGKVADSGISIDVYMEYRNKVSSITGEGKKEKRMAIIHSLPISSRQKDALYYAEGWAESKINEAPWH